MSAPHDSYTLRRSLSLTQLVLYGLGTTIGAGIYLLIGEVSRAAGLGAPAAFLLSSVLAAFTALSFGELASRFPQADGPAAYVREGLGQRQLATVVGLLVAFAGCVSAAAMANGFAGYLSEFLEVPALGWIAAFVVALVAVALWGVGESVSIAGLITIIEIGGLIVIIGVAGDSLAQLPARWPELLPVTSPTAWRGVAMASLFSFYAYLGFEDMVSVAEEVRDAPRNIPLGICITLVATTLLYLLLAAVCVLAVPPSELAASPAPLSFVYERATGSSPRGIAIVGILAVVNGALIQIIMASRVLYGLSARGHLPAWLSRVHSRTRTPHFATLMVGALVLGLAIGFPLAPLAEATSIVTLIVFATVNLALWRLKSRAPTVRPVFVIPRWVPAIGGLTTAGLLLMRVAEALVD